MSVSPESTRFAEVKAIFGEVVDLPPAAREAALAERCAGDADLGAAVRRLLRAHDAAGEFLDRPTLLTAAPPDGASDATPHMEVAPLPFEAVGPYRLISVLGEGGFGTVYLGEQDHPVRRQVAIKILRSGLVNRQALARFDVERQALALMEHPSIARVYDAGTTGSEGDLPGARVPYFVMELVRGRPITQHCDAAGLGPRGRLALFVDVCHAVHHAHQKGVIHRDIKPANVIVTEIDGRAVPKVIDFGVAKAAAAPGDEGALLTEARQLVGTPEYMSPEQAAAGDLAGDVDTRSDVYALGVLLYELLAGVTPFDGDELRRLPLAEMQRRICQTDPPRPSTRVDVTGTPDAGRDGGDPARLRTILRGELDWIVMRCLEKERERRYDSAAALAADCTAFLEGLPVSARPATRLYRAGKFVRRNKLPVGAAAVTVLALAGGLIGTGAALYQAKVERDGAERARAAEAEARLLAEQHVNFIGEMFESIRPELAQGRQVTVREVLDVAAARAGGAFRDRPLAEAAVRGTFGGAYAAIGLLDRAHEQYQRAIELTRAAGTLDRPESVPLRAGFGESLSALGRGEEAERELRAAADLAQSTAGPGSVPRLAAIDRLAAHLSRANRIGEADALRAEIREATADAPDPYRARLSITNEGDLAHLRHLQGRFDEADALYASAVARARALLGPDHPDVLALSLNSAALLRERGRFGDALAVMEPALARARALFGPDHPNTLLTAHQTALVMSATGRTADAEALLADTIARCRTTLGENHATTLFSRHDLAQIWMLTNRREAAEEAMRDLIPRMVQSLGPDHRDTLMFRADLARLLSGRGEPEAAREIYAEVLDGLRRTMGRDHFYTLSTQMRLGATLGILGRWSEAEPLLAEVYEIKRSRGEIAGDWSSATNYGACLERLGKHGEAIPVLLEAEGAIRAYPKLDRRMLRTVATSLAACYAARGEAERAAAYTQVAEEMTASLTTRPTGPPAGNAGLPPPSTVPAAAGAPR